MNKPDWLDLFVLFVPFSLLGAIFGDSIRKDALTRPQRISPGLFSLVVGPVAGLVVMREFGWLDVTALGVAAIAPTLAYDTIGAAAAALRWLRENPGKLAELWPWGKKP